MSTYQKMNPEVKRVWINELRSGRYPQTTRALQDRRGFCCLGVLCDLSGAAEWGPNSGAGRDYGGMYDYPPGSTADWAGMPREVAKHLATLNDDKGKTFDEIADWIEKHL